MSKNLGAEYHRQIEKEKFFEDELVKKCLLDTLPKKLKAAWKVLIGKAGVIYY